ncbi:MAG: hypothetical protein ACXAAT_18310 [Candidatus Hodarchaeales archaeon]|jgi:hypothetical protein
MVSISRILGISLLIIGILSFALINVAGMAFMPFGGSTPPEETSIQIGAFTNDDVFVGAVPPHPMFQFFTSIEITFELQSDFDYSCDVELLFESQSIPIPQVIDGTSRSYPTEPSGTTTKTISTMISPDAAKEAFSISLRLNNIGNNPITVSSRQVNVVYSFFGMIVPGLILLIGAILTIVSFVRGRSASPKVKKRTAPGGWEPTLQWGGGSAASGTKTKAAKKRPKMGISSTRGKTEKKSRIVKKAVPQGGTQLGCKFCGKPVPQNAFFCPHCYGKLK